MNGRPLRLELRARAEAASQGLVRLFERWGVTPNALTLAGGALAVASAWPAIEGRMAFAGLLFLTGSLLDALDGPLARHLGRESRFGAVLDATMDRLGEGALLLGLGIHHAAQGETLWAGVAGAALLFSFLTSYLRAWGERFQVMMAADWFTRPERVAVLSLGLLTGWERPAVLLVMCVAAATSLTRLIRLVRA